MDALRGAFRPEGDLVRVRFEGGAFVFEAERPEAAAGTPAR